MKSKNTNANVDVLYVMGLPSNTGRVNTSTGYKGVQKLQYKSGTVKYRSRIMYAGKEYGAVFNTAEEAAQNYNDIAIDLYGRRKADIMNILNVI